MTAPLLFFSPGSLVRARGREWIVLPGAAETVLRLRPLSGAEGDVQVLDPALEPPHSGDADAFVRLLGLIDPSFGTLNEASEGQRRVLRERLAAHFVQRRRVDIDAWKEKGLFPTHETNECTYRLTGEYQRFCGDHRWRWAGGISPTRRTSGR
jgi:hypothetical protein